jgi:hypothetical protein
MIRFCFVFLCAFLSLWLNSSAQITFQKTFGGVSKDVGRSVQQTADGGYILTGFTENLAAGDSDIYLIKTNEYGNLLWTRTLGGLNNEYGFSVKQTSDGGYIVSGGTRGILVNYSWVYLIKTDANGDTLWTRIIKINDYNSGAEVIQTTDGGFVITGASTTLAGNADVSLIKTDSNGNILWVKSIGDPAYTESGYSVKQTTDGGFIIVGEISGPINTHILLLKTDSSGILMWSKKIGRGHFDAGYSVDQLADGGYIIEGASSDVNSADYHIFLIRTDVNGDTLWTRILGGPNFLGSQSGHLTSDGNYIVAGHKGNLGVNHYNLFLGKVDLNGNSIWTKTFGDTNNVLGISVSQTGDGGYVIVGRTNSFGMGDDDVYLIKTDADGNIGCNQEDTITICTSMPTQISLTTALVNIPSFFIISNNYLNIASSGTSTTICLSDGFQTESVSVKSKVFLSPNPVVKYLTITAYDNLKAVSIFNQLGELFHSLAIINKSQITVDCEDFPPGIYYVQIQNDKGCFTQKLIKQ